MLDLKRIREEPELVRRRLAVRGKPDVLELVDRLLALDEERRAAIAEVDRLRAQRNEASQQVGKLKQEGRAEEAEALIRETRELGERMGSTELRRSAVEETVRGLLLQIPNLPSPDVPPGGEEDNVLVREWGEEPRFTFEPRPHWELGEELGILDLARGAKVAGSGFPVFVGLGARLERGLISMMMDLHAREHGYTELWPPFVVNEQAALGTGHLPKFGDDMYRLPEDGLYLVPTAEIPVTNLHAGEVLDGAALPIRYVAYTPCFRREAGAHGKDTRGLLRLHQFDKVELVRFERPEHGEAALEELTGHAEMVLRRLGLRYRVVLLAGGDLGFSNAKTYDLEVWAPGVGKWLEVSSCSLYTDYQARRANIRYRPAPGMKPEFVYTLNGSGLALPRTLTALLETYQQADGSIRLPEALAGYLGTDRISR
ncbi:MAG TPA: serine--tRNA ligase [Longimicrobiales bacterium]|nr:serine--tRNA ligase [Longimicrobiales bacterium]